MQGTSSPWQWMREPHGKRGSQSMNRSQAYCFTTLFWLRSKMFPVGSWFKAWWSVCRNIKRWFNLQAWDLIAEKEFTQRMSVQSIYRCPSSHICLSVSSAFWRNHPCKLRSVRTTISLHQQQRRFVIVVMWADTATLPCIWDGFLQWPKYFLRCYSS